MTKLAQLAASTRAQMTKHSSRQVTDSDRLMTTSLVHRSIRCRLFEFARSHKKSPRRAHLTPPTPCSLPPVRLPPLLTSPSYAHRPHRRRQEKPVKHHELQVCSDRGAERLDRRPRRPREDPPRQGIRPRSGAARARRHPLAQVRSRRQDPPDLQGQAAREGVQPLDARVLLL